MRLRHFGRHEFHGQMDLCNDDLLLMLDEFRERWGRPVRISPAPGAIARSAGPRSTSQHNIDRWGKTRAIDVFPDGLRTRSEIERAVQIANDVGFTGIGVYPEWHPSPGMHLDTREGRSHGNPARWGAIEDENGNQTYVAMATALDHGQAEGVLA